jgi:hypothetical protein
MILLKIHVNNQQMCLNICDVFYSQYSCQHVSVGNPASSVWCSYYKNTVMVNRALHNN